MRQQDDKRFTIQKTAAFASRSAPERFYSSRPSSLRL
jgi:hypothetical protein